jgi:hypothetical protein
VLLLLPYLNFVNFKFRIIVFSKDFGWVHMMRWSCSGVGFLVESKAQEKKNGPF